MYDIKAFYEAQSVQDAVRLRLEHPQAQILAGGTDVLVQVREGRRAGAELISIYSLDALRGVTLDGVIPRQSPPQDSSLSVCPHKDSYSLSVP